MPRSLYDDHKANSSSKKSHLFHMAGHREGAAPATTLHMSYILGLPPDVSEVAEALEETQNHRDDQNVHGHVSSTDMDAVGMDACWDPSPVPDSYVFSPSMRPSDSAADCWRYHQNNTCCANPVSLVQQPSARGPASACEYCHPWQATNATQGSCLRDPGNA